MMMASAPTAIFHTSPRRRNPGSPSGRTTWSSITSPKTSEMILIIPDVEPVQSRRASRLLQFGAGAPRSRHHVYGEQRQQQEDHEEHQEDPEQDFCDGCRAARHAGEAECAGDERDDEEDDRPFSMMFSPAWARPRLVRRLMKTPGRRAGSDPPPSRLERRGGLLG